MACLGLDLLEYDAILVMVFPDMQPCRAVGDGSVCGGIINGSAAKGRGHRMPAPRMTTHRDLCAPPVIAQLAT